MPSEADFDRHYHKFDGRLSFRNLLLLYEGEASALFDDVLDDRIPLKYRGEVNEVIQPGNALLVRALVRVVRALERKNGDD